MIHKRDAFQMDRRQLDAGRRMWDKTSSEGRLAKSSFDAEANAPKTWLFYVNSKNELLCEPIECELYTVGRLSDAREAVVMLHGMCPKCGETFIAREDNKTMSVDVVTYRKASRRFREQWNRHCREKLLRRPRDEDKILVVSSPERWACDYCKQWCVRVHGGVASDDHRGVTQITVPANVPLINPDKPTKGAIDF